MLITRKFDAPWSQALRGFAASAQPFVRIYSIIQ
jgi:hypothetical protein